MFTHFALLYFICVSFCALKRFSLPFRYCWQNAKGNHRPRSINNQDQDHRSTRKKVLRMDRWIHPCLSLHFPTNVDLQTRIRRIRTRNCPPQVLLSAFNLPSHICYCVTSSSSYDHGFNKDFTNNEIFVNTLFINLFITFYYWCIVTSRC